MTNIHQHVFPTTIITVPNVSVLITQAMNPSIGHIIILVNYQTTWSEPVAPIVPGKTNMLPTSTYPMCYNVIPPFVPLDLSLYPTYPIGTKGLDSSTFRNYTGYVHGSVYPIPEQLIVRLTYIPNSIRNQILIMVQQMTRRTNNLFSNMLLH